jgi:hypothetical protein
LLCGGEARRMLLQTLSAEELLAQDLVAVPWRDGSASPQDVTQERFQFGRDRGDGAAHTRAGAAPAMEVP